jgi:6-pyruvoyltetrahydropterin/6-carboxytetrahydropterin synthase
VNRLVVEIPSVPYGHRLYGYEGKCSRQHGHNARVTLTIEGEALDAQGFVCDFYEVRTVLLKALARFDHFLVLGPGDPLVEMYEAAGEPFARFDHPPTAEHLARWVLREVATLKPAGAPWRPVSVRWEEEPGFAAEAVP